MNFKVDRQTKAQRKAAKLARSADVRRSATRNLVGVRRAPSEFLGVDPDGFAVYKLNFNI